MRANWTAPTDAATAYRRAGGRRAYNARRALLAAYRRLQVVGMLSPGWATTRGTQARIARELGVSRATICRDLAFLLRKWQERTFGVAAPDPMTQVRERLAELWSSEEGDSAQERACCS